jgi:hypothetical protein
MKNYKTHPEIFSKEAHNIIDNILNPPQWKDFHTVVDRLNAPELIDFYIWAFISYKFGTRLRAPENVLINREGDCDDLAYFSNIALRRAGYSTTVRRVLLNGEGHIGLAVKINQEYYLVVDFTTPLGNKMSGPFMNLRELDLALSRGQSRGKQYSFTY